MTRWGAFLRLLALSLCGASALGCAKSQKQKLPEPEVLQQAERMLGGKTEVPGLPHALPYRLYVPDGQPAEKQKLPLVLFLHAAGPRGTDNLSQVTPDLLQWTTRAQRTQKAYVLAPQCPPGEQWVNAANSAPYLNYDQAKVPENAIAKLVFALLAEVKKGYPVDEQRIYITGASMGGSAAWDYVTRYPGIFAAAVPVTGVNDPSRAAVIARLPIWAFHGAQDQGSPVTNTRAMVAALQALGSAVRYTEYPDVGHNSWGRAYGTEELYPWVFQQRLGQADPTTVPADAPANQ